MGPKTRSRIRNRLIEFFIVGLLMGVTEDLLAILLATDAELNLKVVAVAALVAFPFAIISELIVDSATIRKYLWKSRKK